MDGKFSVGYRDAVVRTVVNLDRETTAAYTLVLEAIGTHQPSLHATTYYMAALGRVHMRRPPRSQLALTPAARVEPEALP